MAVFSRTATTVSSPTTLRGVGTDGYMIRKTAKTLPGATPLSEPASIVRSWPSPAIMASWAMSTTYWLSLPLGGVSRVAGGRVTTSGTFTFSNGRR